MDLIVAHLTSGVGLTLDIQWALNIDKNIVDYGALQSFWYISTVPPTVTLVLELDMTRCKTAEM